jgi:hypothetical protein
VRTIDRYRRRAARGEGLERLGRPPTAAERRAQVAAWVDATKLPASAGWRPVLRKIRDAHGQEKVSAYAVQREVARRKEKRRTEEDAARKAAEAAIAARRVSYEILAKDTVWGEDTSYVGRDEHGGRVEVEMVRDPASTKVLALPASPPRTGAQVVELLERTSRERGGPPLVHQHDNAAIYTCQEVVAYAERERVVMLLSRVATPTDHAGTERAIGESKQDVGLRKGDPVLDPWAKARELEEACRQRDEVLPRASRGWWTANDLDAALPRADAVVDRETFCRAACEAKAKAVEGIEDPDAARLAERDAVFATLVRFGLARRRVGPQRLAPMAEARAPLRAIG